MRASWASMSKEARLDLSREWFGPIARALGGCKVRLSESTGKPFLVVPVGERLASVAWTKGDAFVLHHPFPHHGAGERLASAAAAIERLVALRAAA